MVRQVVQKELATRKTVSEVDLLDFGCSPGVLLADLAKLGSLASGVDTSEAMIAKARAHLASIDLGKVNLECLRDSSGTGDYQTRRYDIVVCTSVLEFIPDMESAISKLAACMRSGGILILSVPNRQSVLRRSERFIYRYPKSFRQFPKLHHLTSSDSYLSIQQHQLTLAELTSIAESYGLRKEEHLFHVAPQMLGSLERRSSVGMMMMAVFRK